MTDLMKLTELCAAFKEAEEAHLKGNLALQQKALESLQPGEMEELQSMAMELATGGLNVAMGGKITEDFLKLNIKAADKVAELALRVLPEDTLRENVPTELKSEANVKALAANGAPTIARLAGPK